MSLKQKLTDLTTAIADKTNELHTLAEMKSNKQQDLTSNDTEHYPSVPAVVAGLSTKVDKVAGKGLSDENYTLAEKDKLAGLESSKFRGFFTDESLLPTTGNSEGSYADVDGGIGEPTVRHIWDNNDSIWVAQIGESTQMTAAQIKALYESNADTNAFTDAEKSDVASNTTHRGRIDNPHNVTKAQVGLGNVDNTSDINKPVSTAQQTAINGVASGVTDLETELITYYKALGQPFPDYEAQYIAALNF